MSGYIPVWLWALMHWVGVLFFGYIYHSGLGLDLKVQKYLASHVWTKFYGEFRGIASIQ